MERNVSCLNSRAVIEYVKRHCPEFTSRLIEDLEPYFEYVPDVENYLLDEHNWISQHVCAELFRRVREHTGDPEVAKKIGHESVRFRRFGSIHNLVIKAFGHPYLTILRAPAINARFNKTKTVEIIESNWSRAVIRLKWFRDIGSTKDICQYNMGVYEAIPTIWKLPLARSSEDSCFFEGDEYCEYTFEWAKKSLLTLIFGGFSRRREILEESLAELEREKTIVERKYREVDNLNTELEKKIEQLTSLDTCSKATSTILDTDKLLNVVMSLIVNIMQFDRAIIMLVDEKTNDLVPVKGVSSDSESLEAIEGYTVPLDRTSNILARVVDSGVAQIIRDVDHSFLRKENIILKKFNPKSFVAVPLVTRKRVIGILAAERVRGLDDFSTADLDYVMNFCNQIAISLDNATLVDKMKDSFVSSILSLASALEAKDSYTRGHSNHVAAYSTMIADEMGLDEQRVEDIRLMALMHDIGKIGIPDSIINKPGKLTNTEFNLIKQHPHVSLRIVEPLLTNNPEIRHVKSHHERFDGRGYPDGLSGNDIPVEARIIAVADSFDAMTTDRPYRTALSRGEAFEEVLRGAGSQFCPEVVGAFTRVMHRLTDDDFQRICRAEESPADDISRYHP